MKTLARTARTTTKRGKSSLVAMSNKMSNQVSKVSKELAHQVPKLKRVKAVLGTARDKAERLIRKNPLRAVVGASAVGFVLAKLKRVV